jgi:amidase
MQRPGPLRIAVSFDPVMGRQLHPDCQAAVRNAAALLEDLGHQVEEIHLPVDREQLILDFTILVAGELGAVRREGERLMQRPARRSDFEVRTWALMQLAEAFTAADDAAARGSLDLFARRWLIALSPYDVLLTATLGAPPAEIGALRPTAAERLTLRMLDWKPLARIGARRDFLVENGQALYDYVSQTIPANVSGQPSMNVPLHWSADGVPIGTQFTGRPGHELTLFRLAAQLEQARPWAARRPPLWAGTP